VFDDVNSFGAFVRGRRTGIVFNNEMDDFSTPGLVNIYGFPPSPNNYIEPGKIPQSSMCPTIVLDQKGNVAFMGGGAGGSRITTGTAFVMINNLWLQRDVHTATNLPRIHHQLVPNILYYESNFDKVS
jgi:gamma-glutamyltranspeptidase / glutathione hydrolase / leukotriene-C4 hydrolase